MRVDEYDRKGWGKLVKYLLTVIQIFNKNKIFHKLLHLNLADAISFYYKRINL